MEVGTDLLKVSVIYLFRYNIFTEARCVIIEDISSKKTQLQLIFASKIKDLKSTDRRINLT